MPTSPASSGGAITTPTGQWVQVNPALTEILGYTQDELVGLDFRAITHPDDLEPNLELFSRALAGQADGYQLEKRFIHKQGHLVWVTLNALAVRDEAGGLRYFVVQMQDVTERAALEAQLRQAQKMEAVGQLAGGIAHDFNNLLTAILTHSQFLLGELAEGPTRQDAAVIRETAERAAGLTRQLLAFSRKEDVQPGPLDLNAVVAATEQMLGRILGSGIRVSADLAPALGPVLAHPGQLEQVLMNLALNSRDAMPLGGALTLRTRAVAVDEATARARSGLAAGRYAVLTVDDTGVGIPPELQGRIFEPFFTTKPVGQGTGLGLSTVYGIVKQWGGYIAVESAPGRGSTFTIYLPSYRPTPARAPEPAAAAAADERGPGGGGTLSGSETILVVEDEPMVRRALRRILARHGYTVLEAEHGADALRVIREAAAPIDLVLTDLVMPEMGGRALIAVLAAEPESPTILAMSGYEMQTALSGEPLPAGTPFVAKPFTVDAMLAAVRAALDASPRRRRH